MWTVDPMALAATYLKDIGITFFALRSQMLNRKVIGLVLQDSCIHFAITEGVRPHSHQALFFPDSPDRQMRTKFTGRRNTPR